MLGWGVADLPRVIEAPTPALDVALTTNLAAATLDFKLAINDIGEAFSYAVDCGDWFSELIVEPSDATLVADGIQQAPVTLPVLLDEEISCTVTSSLDGFDETGVATASITIPAAILPPTVTLTAKAAGALLTVNASASESQGALTYSAACQIDGDDITLDGGNSVDAGVAVAISANPEQEISCSAIAIAGENESEPSEGVAVTALAASATSITLTPDLGGFVISVSKDSDLVDPSLVEVVVTCTQDGQTIVDAVVVEEGGLFVETESELPVTCEATSKLSVNDVISDVDTVLTGGATITPEPASSGLPIWLLYQATQP